MKKKAKKIKRVEPTKRDLWPVNRGEWLLLAIKLTERTISNPPLKSDRQMMDQSDRYQNELAEWKKANRAVKLRML